MLDVFVVAGRACLEARVGLRVGWGDAKRQDEQVGWLSWFSEWIPCGWIIIIHENGGVLLHMVCLSREGCISGYIGVAGRVGYDHPFQSSRSKASSAVLAKYLVFDRTV